MLLGSLATVGALQAADVLPGLLGETSSRQASGVDPTFGDQSPDGGNGGEETTNADEPTGDGTSSGGRARNNDFTVGGAKEPVVETDVANKVFYDAAKPAKFSFSFDFGNKDYFKDHRVVGKVDLQKKNRGEEIDTWRVKVGDSGDQTVKWQSDQKGKDKAPSPGKYEFKVTPEVDGKIVKPKKGHKDSSPSATIDFYTHIFPVDGNHNLDGGKAGRFGAGRQGHTHQGQDVFAKCGTPLRAARGGKVQANQFQANAGFYVVIDGDGTDVDYVYVHLKKRSDFREGDKISTGERFAQVGDTGDAQGCHLHFELWTGPGWFEGGKAYDPLPQMKGWDKYS